MTALSETGTSAANSPSGLHPALRLLDGAALLSVADREVIHGPGADELERHLMRYGPRPAGASGLDSPLLAGIEAAGLTGRGGAGFPVAVKWRTALESPGVPVVVGNGAESETLSAKDAALMQLRPHLVLDGLISTAEALGADRAVLWLHKGAKATRAALLRAIEERAAAGLNDLPVTISAGPHAYVTGESSAIVNRLDGLAALPGFTLEPPARSGVHGRPTIIQNVETLARIALASRFGESARPSEALVTVASGADLTVLEVPLTTILSQVVLPFSQELLGDAAPLAILIGGYGGRWASWANVSDLALHELDGRDGRPSLGTGILAPIPRGACGITESAVIADYLARSSARQCGPCVFGTRALADGLTRIADGAGTPTDVARLSQVATEVDGRGACAMPNGLVQMARSALEVFSTDVNRHLERRGRKHGGGRTFLPVPEDAS